MWHVRVVNIVTLLAASAFGIYAQSDIDLARLTAPDSRLAGACTLSRPTAAPSVGLPTNAGFWLANFENPWHGFDAPRIANIREQIEGVSPMPDGPPLSSGERARFRARLADDVEDAYAGFYYSSDGSSLVQVYALRFKIPESARQSPARSASVRISRGRTLIVAYGRNGECLDTIVAYLKELELP